jgi:hypothetical protein
VIGSSLLRAAKRLKARGRSVTESVNLFFGPPLVRGDDVTSHPDHRYMERFTASLSQHHANGSRFV